MPKKGAWARGEQMAALTEVSAELIGSEAAADELAQAEEMAGALEPAEQADLFEMRRTHIHSAAVPKALQAAKSRLEQSLQAIWNEAKPANDFKAFAGPFEEMLGLIREIAAAKADALQTSRYSALMDEFDPGVGEREVDPVFDDLAVFLPPLIAEVRERQAAWTAPLPFPGAPVEAQARLAQRLALTVGHDPDAFRIDAAPHPFSIPHSPGDVRFTTRYDVNDIRFSIMATLHEAGHAMYEANLPRDFAFRPVGMARGMTVHESQSLSVEMVIGRSREFLAWLAPAMGEAFGEDPAFAFANVLNAWRRLDNGYIRVNADEISYPLHVILRYRLEKALLSGDLTVADLPAAWDEAFERLFGRRPPDMAHGCLQDIHWAAGMVGYFPNYAMGSMLAAQLVERATAEAPDILPALGQGDLVPYFAWVKPRVHARASLVDFKTLVEDATGGPLTPEAYKRHVRRRYLEEAAP
jgi:carboxypeptidase Taq